MDAFRTAAELGADAVELDVRRTADGQLVVHHDAKLADGRLVVATRRDDLPLYVPSLDAALDACGHLWVNVEIKNIPFEADFDPKETVADAVVAFVVDAGRVDDVLVSSFHLPTVDRVRHHDAGIRTAFLALRATTGNVARTVRHGHAAFHPWEKGLRQAVVGFAHREGVEVNTWTVDNPNRIAELSGWGVDGIVTNTPDVAREVVGPPGD